MFDFYVEFRFFFHFHSKVKFGLKNINVFAKNTQVVCKHAGSILCITKMKYHCTKRIRKRGRFSMTRDTCDSDHFTGLTQYTIETHRCTHMVKLGQADTSVLEGNFYTVLVLSYELVKFENFVF